VWLGNDDNSPTKHATGGGLPVEVWTRFMRAAHQNIAPAPLPNSDRGLFGAVASALSPATDQGASPAPQATLQPPPLAALPTRASSTPSSYTGSGMTLPPPTPASVRPAQNVRPEASAGLDGGWLVNRLFGR